VRPKADNDRELGSNYRLVRNERDSSVFETQVMCTSTDYDIYATSCGMRMFRYSGRSPWMNVDLWDRMGPDAFRVN
jgi:hypothetical protein